MLSQAEDESTYADYTPLAIHLADEHFLSHQSRLETSGRAKQWRKYRERDVATIRHFKVFS